MYIFSKEEIQLTCQFPGIIISHRNKIKLNQGALTTVIFSGEYSLNFT